MSKKVQTRVHQHESRESSVRQYFRTLSEAWGAQHWWPAESALEVIVGAFLTQNTAWSNVEKALAKLRAAGALNLEGLRELEPSRIEELIRPAGYFRQKARRLKSFVAWLDLEYGGSLKKMLARPTEELRAELLGLNGVGPETADSILLYAGHHESFVVDAYTRRIFERHALIDENASYEAIRELVQKALSAEVEEASGERRTATSVPEVHRPSTMSEAPKSERARRYNEFHGLIVQVGKHHCKKAAPRCEGCPLEKWL